MKESYDGIPCLLLLSGGRVGQHGGIRQREERREGVQRGMNPTMCRDM